VGCRSPILEEQDELVKVYTRMPLLPLEGASDVQILEFRGKRYSHLYSVGYVSVPELNGIIFATRREGRNVNLHYVPKQGKKEVTVDEGEAYCFGGNLGCPRDAKDTQYVESVADGKITFFSTPGPAERYEGRTEGHRYVLDLQARTFSRVRDRAQTSSSSTAHQ